jgi:hypothetical protein
MSIIQVPLSSNLIPGKPFFWRHDVRSTRIVDLGISLQERFGVEYAAGFMKENGIPMSVAIRVLAHPLERRSPVAEAFSDI